DTVIYHYPDGRGSTRLTVDADEAVLGTLHYDAFGNRTGGNIGVSHQYTGEYFDEYTGFYHLRARDYDPRVGRFISMDAFEGILQDPLTRNKYLYAHGDPVNNRDPSGY